MKYEIGKPLYLKRNTDIFSIVSVYPKGQTIGHSENEFGVVTEAGIVKMKETVMDCLFTHEKPIEEDLNVVAGEEFSEESLQIKKKGRPIVIKEEVKSKKSGDSKNG